MRYRLITIDQHGNTKKTKYASNDLSVLERKQKQLNAWIWKKPNPTGIRFCIADNSFTELCGASLPTPLPSFKSFHSCPTCGAILEGECESC